MIKVIWAMHRKPDMPFDEFYSYWHDTHGMKYGRAVQGMRRYIQHHTLPEARDGERPVPTHDGASIAWFEDFDQLLATFESPEWKAMGADAPNLFHSDGEKQTAVIFANERVVLDGETTPSMVKMLSLATKDPGISFEEFRDRWYAHGELCKRVPGQRRYVQNHPLPEAYDPNSGLGRQPTHDGWAEHWFDDLASLRAALASPEWAELSADARGLFAPGKGASVTARETPIVP